MLLRRMIDHVKEQNWTAVALDFFIVVAGILIAFQITEWSNARQVRRDEVIALQRLQDESEENLRYFQELVARNNERNQHRIDAIAALTAGSIDGFDREIIEGSLFTLARYPAITPKKSTYNELNASGQLAKISDAKVRESLAAYYSELDSILSQLEFFRMGVRDNDDYAGLSMAYVYAPSKTGLLQRKVDFEALASNEPYVQHATSLLRGQLVFQSYRRRMLTEAENVCRELSRATGETCEPLANSASESAPDASSDDD